MRTQSFVRLNLQLLVITVLTLILVSCTKEVGRNGYSSHFYELDGYEIKDVAKIEFPKGVRYQLTIKGAELQKIEDVEIHFILGTARTRYLVKPNLVRNESAVVAEHFERFAQSAGDLVEYWYVLTEASGNTVETPQENFVYLDSDFTWNSLEESDITVYYYDYYESSKEAAKDVLSVASESKILLEQMFEVKVTSQWRIVMYQDLAKLNEAMPKRSDYLSESFQYAGQASPTYGTILIYDYDPIYPSLTKHEVVHMILHEVIKPNNFNLPSWLDEGIADYLSTDDNGAADYIFEQAVKENKLLPFYSLTTQPGTPEEINLLYSQSKEAVGFMVQRYGLEKLPMLLRNLKRMRLDTAFIQTFGVSLEEFERAWHQSLGLTPK